MQSFRFFHSFITINSIVMPTHRKSTGTTPFDSQTLGELYETYAPQLLRICLRYVKNQAEAEDVLHDAFVIIFTHIDHLRDETKLVHWMTVIVRNLALRQAKATEERRRLHEAMTEELADDDSPPPSSVVPMERLLEAIETLPRGYGEVFRLAVLDGLSHEEIGQLLGIAPHSSSSQLARAKRMLRKALGRLPTAPCLTGSGGRLDLQAAQHAPASGTFDGRPASPSSSKGDAFCGTQEGASDRKRKAQRKSRVYHSSQRANTAEVLHDFSDASAIVRATHRRSSQICRVLRSASGFVAKRRHLCTADCRRPNRRSTVGNGCSYPLPGCSQALSLDCEFRWRSGHSFIQFAHQV